MPTGPRVFDWRIPLLLAGCLCLPSATPSTSAETAPQADCRGILGGDPGREEELTFSVRWGLISAGTATLKLTPLSGREDGARYRIETVARSNALIDAFYKVRDQNVTLTDGSFRRCLYSSKIQREGSFSRDEVVEYDPREGTAILFRDGRFKNSLRLPTEYQDPLSGLYRFRTMPAAPGELISMYATDGRRVMKIRGQVQKREEVTVPAGTFRCLKTELFPETLEGPFIRKKHGRIFLWFTDDECRLPVKVSTEIVIGAVQTELDKVEYRPVTP